MEPQWTPVFEELARNVQSALRSDSHDYVHTVLSLLEANKSSILALFDSKAPNPAHRAQLKLGTPVIGGKERSVNEQFIAGAIILSDQLEMDEYAAASLFQHGIQQHTRFDRTPVDTSIILFHRERIALLYVIYAILDTAGSVDSPTEFSKAIVPLRNDLLAASNGNLANKALVALETLDKKSKSLKNDMTATSNLVVQLGMAINEDRLDYIQQERTLLARILFAIAFYHELPSTVLKANITALKTMNLSDPITIYLAVTVMAAFEVSAEHMRIRGKAEEEFPQYMTQNTFVTEYAQFITSTNWAVPAIQATILFQLSLCVGNISGHNNNGTGLTEDDLQAVAERAIEMSTFQFIANYILGFKSQVVVTGKPFEVPFVISNALLGIVDQNTDGFDTTVGKPVAVRFDTSLQDGVLALLEFTVRDFIITMQPLLRKIKHREEDNAAHQSSLRQSQSTAITAAPRNDLEALFTVVALIYKDRPEAGLRFWPNNDDRLYRFLKWGVDCKNTARSFFDMLGSLATGPQCAQYAYDFLKSNGGRYGTQSSATPNTLCSWGKLFEAIDFYTKELNKDVASGGHIEKIRPDEEALLKSFLNLLCTVGQYSPVARAAMNESKQSQVIHSLFLFFICPISVDLKACVLDSIAAFAAPSAAGTDNANLVWEYLEQARILPKSYSTALPEPKAAVGDKAAVPAATTTRQENENMDSGIGFDIDEIETSNETFPETIAFTRLLSSLVQVPLNPEDLLSGGSPTIPDNLGSTYRQPGVIPYARFILDKIFVKAFSRSYRVANEKWKVVDSCLDFMERCLLSYDIGSFILGDLPNSQQDHTTIEAQRNNALRASLHPAFEILTRLLAGGDVLQEVFRIISTGVDVLNKEDRKTPYLKSSIARSFRIVSKVMQLQDVFVEYIVPVLLTTSTSRNSLLSSLVPLEQHLAYSNSTIVDIACYINCDVSNEICSLSIEILDRLSASHLFTSSGMGGHRGIVTNRLVRLLENSPQSTQILFGFVNKLEAEDEEQSTDAGSPSAGNAMSVDGPDSSLTVAQRRAVLGGPSFTGSKIRLQIMRLLLDNLDESRSPPSIAHFLLGYPTESKIITSEDKDALSNPTSVTVLHVILDLLRRGMDGQDIDYNVPDTVPLYITHPQLAEKCQELIYRLCSEAETTAPTMRYLRTAESFFYRHLRALPFRFEGGLEGDDGTFTRMDNSSFRGNFVNLVSQLYQRSWVMRTSALELRVACDTNQRREAIRLLSLLFSSTDNGRSAHDDDYMYSLTKTQNGHLTQPRMKVLELLDSLDFTWDDDVKVQELERHYFADITVDACVEKDEHGISLGPGFDFLKVEQRESMLYDVLEAILFKLQRDCSADVATILGKAALCILQRLRSDHFRQCIFQATSADPREIDARLPAERLHRVARNIIACILKSGTSQSRCNLYSTLVNYFQYTRSEGDSHRSMKSAEHYRLDGQPALEANGRGDNDVREALELGNQVLVSEAGDRLFEVVCRDASDIDQVCKIAAFTLLNTLYGLFEKDNTNRVLIHLVQRNYLKHFIEIMAREDLDLQASIKGRVSRVPIVSETRLTLFLRIAQRRDGAEQLLEYGYFDVLTASAAVIDMRTNLNTTDFGPFEQTEGNRYHNIVYPMLQVGVAILANLGRNHRTAANKAESFVTSHQDTIASILRDDDFPTTINSLRELRSITAFFNQLAGHIATRTAATGSVFGPLHSLLVALIPKYFSAEQWSASLQPVSDSEKLLASMQAPSLTARKGTTLFERDAKSLARDICKNLLSYCQIHTDRNSQTATTTSTTFTPLFTWTVSTATSGYDSSSVPSLATLVGLMNRTTTDLQGGIQRHQTQLLKLNKLSSLTPDEKQEILEASDEDYLDSLVAIQRDQLAVQVLQKMLLTSTHEVTSSLYVLETALVLFWRHLDYYLGQYPGQLDVTGAQPGLGASRFGRSGLNGINGAQSSFRSTVGPTAADFNKSQSQSQSQLSKNFKPTLAEAQELKRDVGNIVLSTLDNIMGLDLSQERIGWDNTSRNTFIEMLIRNIRSLVERH
ncbi:hypothetical protein BGZ96_008357 [Linnemannia gamsii]|uniref:Nucleoporin n=1 Tax=Linnemannia gamsii TaxID=64522 RepID=A0ABQ7K0N8_9FUNG|nr:hypothetical protein BGZ96_008357 [Linnemannia gamsii]